MDGWIKIYRKLKDWEWYTDSNVVHLFIHLLLSANFTETRRKGVIYNAGQVATSIVMLAAELDKSYPTILRCLKILSESGVINVKSTNKKTIITICKYKQYQQDSVSCYKNNLDQTLEQPLEQVLDQTLEQPLEPIYNKNIKKEKNVKNEGNIIAENEKFDFEENENQNNGTINDKKEKEKNCAKKEKTKKFNPMEFIKNEPAESRELLERWLNYKQAEFGKSYKTEGSFKAFIKRLNDMSGGNFETAKAIIEQSIANCYQGIFELKKQYQNGNQRNNGDIPIERIVAAGRLWASVIQ